jgi:hypothetical protein
MASLYEGEAVADTLSKKPARFVGARQGHCMALHQNLVDHQADVTAQQRGA